MTKEILTKEQIKSELDRGRKRLFPISVSCFLLCFILAGVGVALTVSLAGEYKEYKEKVLFFYIYIVFFHNLYYFKILYNNEAKEMSIDVPENQSDVLVPISEFFAFDSLGVTYTTSFCCR